MISSNENDTGFPSIVHFYDIDTVHQTLKRGDLGRGSGIESHFLEGKYVGTYLGPKFKRSAFSLKYSSY